VIISANYWLSFQYQLSKNKFSIIFC